ncbi:unnamed protein product [Moneuplotes crassus]|uniref:Uncharacterized protein n=1 Tax=Euplotes crassus TaxID=5936 RepID=A0AAD1XD15_EUPCR|nr:unnamed protein product [Moneuplotes crassus]
MSSKNHRRTRLRSIEAPLRNSFCGETLPDIKTIHRRSIAREKRINTAKLRMKRRSIVCSIRQKNLTCTKQLFSPKPKKLAFFSKKINLIPNFWNKKKAKKMVLERTMNLTKGKILICKRQTEGERREQIKEIFNSMDAKYSKYIKQDIQRMHKIVL